MRSSLAGPTARREKLNFLFRFANKHKDFKFYSNRNCAAKLLGGLVVTSARENAIVKQHTPYKVKLELQSTVVYS